MADKKLEAAEKKVQELKAEQQRIAARVADLEAKRTTAPTRGLSKIATELAELRETENVLAARLKPAMANQKAERQRVNASKVLELREVETRQWTEVKAVLFDKLVPKLYELAKTHRQLLAIGSGPNVGDTALFQAVVEAHRRRAVEIDDHSEYFAPWER